MDLTKDQLSIILHALRYYQYKYIYLDDPRYPEYVELMKSLLEEMSQK
tara:strand:+ start:898 stop:1041 length:144 start_codon:yes stop_codon:yes gene_type:complete